MKKNPRISLFLLLGALVLLQTACSESDETTPFNSRIHVTVPDENFERKLIQLGIDSDGFVNHHILKSDASKVIALDVDSPQGTPTEEKITDLGGIEAFENLLFLSAGNNTLQEVNLASNSKLESLHLEDNYLQTIDVSNNENLTDMSLILNDLTSVSGLEATQHLKTLNLSYNYLRDFSINISSLEGLNVENNFLKTLSVTGCSSLTSLIAKFNELETIDLSTNVDLRFVTISANRINELTLESNTNIEKLRLSSNQVKSLNVSNLTKLNELSIHENSDLTCVIVAHDQEIGTVNKQDHQELRTNGCI